MARPPGHGPEYEKRRRQIIDLSAQLMAKKGYAATGISEICSTVSLAKGALYYYIKSKEDLLVEIQSRVLVPLLGASNRIMHLDVAPLLRLRLLSETMLTVMIERLDHVWCYEHDYKQLTGARLTHLVDQRHAFEDTVAKVMLNALDEGLFRVDLKPRVAMLQFMNLHNYTYQWFDPRGPWTASHLSREYCRTLFFGFCDRPDLSFAIEDDVAAFKASWPTFFTEVLSLDDV